MDAPDLDYDQLTELARDRRAWRRSMLGHDEDISELTSPAKLAVHMHPTASTEEERKSVIKAWEAVFKPKKKVKNTKE